MSFPVLWRKWIKECVCTTTASVLVNGCPTEEFPLERGLRQGGLLSPFLFLFLLAAEGLNVLMEVVVGGGRLRAGGWRRFSWWREIARVRKGGKIGARWFEEHVSRRVGDGSDTFFWTDPWVDGIPLCERFGRLFALAETKRCTMAEMFSLGWGADGTTWVWRRQLRGWEEEELRECQSLLLTLSLQDQSLDKWQ
ncbi:hypothetical protein QL285_093578 [Trifolium repens]|nr:hypothetical protein QL285_093578 [Trifolium repens]